MSASDNAKNVAKYIIRQTPIGHLEKAKENLNVVVGEEIMDSDEIKNEIKEYSENHLNQIDTDNNTKVVISSLTKDANGSYYDQSQKIKFDVDFNSQKVINSETVEVQNELRDITEDVLKSYLEKYYKPEVTKSNVYFDEASNKLVVLISAHNINLKNFWSGEWLSTWELEVGSNNVKGNIKANTYYYEEGNIQFNLNTNFEEALKGNNNEEIAIAFVKAIEKNENNVQLELENVYNDFSDKYIKPLRRKLPVTGTKMNWSLNQIQFNK